MWLFLPPGKHLVPSVWAQSLGELQYPQNKSFQILEVKRFHTTSQAGQPNLKPYLHVCPFLLQFTVRRAQTFPPLDQLHSWVSPHSSFLRASQDSQRQEKQPWKGELGSGWLLRLSTEALSQVGTGGWASFLRFYSCIRQRNSQRWRAGVIKHPCGLRVLEITKLRLAAEAKQTAQQTPLPSRVNTLPPTLEMAYQRAVSCQSLSNLG